MVSLPFILRRATRHWQLMLTLSLGVFLTTALLTSGPLLVDAVVEMGLSLTLQSTRVPDGNVRLVASTQPSQAAYDALDSQIQAELESALGEHLELIIRSIESQWMFPWVDGELATDQRLNLRAYDGMANRVEYLAGRWPTEPSTEPTIVRGVVSDAMARSLVLRVGDRLPISLTQGSTVPDLWIEVAGIVVPKNPRERYWYGEFSPLTSQKTQRWSAQYSVIVPRDALFAVASSLPTNESLETAWYVLLGLDALSVADIQPLQGQLDDLSTRLETLRPRVTLHTAVPAILASFGSQLESIRVPLYIFVAEIMLLGLYYVTMVAALSMRQVEREFAVLRSRGASRWQITMVHLSEALIILTAAFVGGPWLGEGLVETLSWVGPLADVSQAGWSLAFTHSVWLASGIGTLVCLAGLMLPLGPALRRSIVTHHQMAARRIQPPWWQRLYLDVFVLAVGLALLWRLRLYGEMTTGGPGGARLDWLLLLSPVAFLLGSATILLRVFPLLLRLMASRSAREPGLVGPLALWQASRDPTHVTRLVLLLTLAIALANLSTGLNTTLDQSEYDRATYLAGTDLRLVSERAVPLKDLQQAPGVLQLSSIWRGEGTVALESTQIYPRFELAAIEPESFSEVAPFRKDFAGDDMGELLAHLAVDEGQHPSLLSLPGQPSEFGIWLWGALENKAELDSYQRWIDGDSDAERVGVVAKLQTAQGELFNVNLQPSEATIRTDRVSLQMSVGGRDVALNLLIKPDNQGWMYLGGFLPVLPASSYPLSLHSLWFQNRATRLGEPIVKPVFVVVDNLIVIDAETQEPQIVEDFEAPDRTVFLNIMDGDSIHDGLFTEAVSWSNGTEQWGQTVYLRYNRPLQTYAMRLRQTWTSAPLPAIASPAFIETTQLGVGDVVRASVDSADVDFRIVGTVRYFPTMYEEMEAGYLITSRDLLLALLNDTSQLPTNPNEVLIATDGSTSIDTLSALVPMLSESWEAESVRRTLKANPLALGLRGVTFFGSGLTILLSLVGFATHFYMTVRQREMLYGVMRSLGMSPRQMYAWIAFEQVVLILAGLALGTGLGMVLNQIALPRLPVSLGDRAPVPPFVPRADWVAIGGLYLFLFIALLLILAVVTALLWRARIHRALRIGQE